MVADDTPERCPSCAAALARYGEDPPWCPRCEWNLETRRYRGNPPRAAEERARLRAFAQNKALIDELGAALPGRPKTSRTRVVLTLASLVLLVFDFAVLGLGAYWLKTGPGNLRVVGVLLVLIGLECRLRWPRQSSAVGRLRESDAPALWAVVEDARRALGAPRIDVLTVVDQFNASCARSGLRRRTVLRIGLPLWGVLSPAARMALLGHELGHLVNGDPTTSFTTQPALTTLGRLANVFDPRGFHLVLWTERLVAPFLWVFLAPVQLVCAWGQRGLLRVAATDHQRAEIHADALAVRLGGSAGAEELLRALLHARPVIGTLRAAATDGEADPDLWRDRVARVIEQRVPNTRTAEQLSLRTETSAYDSHPPNGLRLRLVRSWPTADPILAQPSAALADADRELADGYRRVMRSMASATTRTRS